MKTRTENDVKRFNDALNRCRRPVFLVSADGTQYNMKSTEDYYTGMAKWIRDLNNELEIFTCGYEDEEVMTDFYNKMCA